MIKPSLLHPSPKQFDGDPVGQTQDQRTARWEAGGVFWRESAYFVPVKGRWGFDSIAFVAPGSEPQRCSELIALNSLLRTRSHLVAT